jgi:prophage regulatory protein
MVEEILRKRRVLSVIGMGNTWLHDAVKRKEFPAPVRLGARAVGWKRSDVEAWVANRQSAV